MSYSRTTLYRLRCPPRTRRTRRLRSRYRCTTSGNRVLRRDRRVCSLNNYNEAKPIMSRTTQMRTKHAFGQCTHCTTIVKSQLCSYASPSITPAPRYMKSSATKPRARPVGGLPVDVQYTPAATMRKPPPITTPCTGETSTFSAHTGRPARATRVPARAGSTKALHVAQRASIHSDDARIRGAVTPVTKS